MTRVVFAMGRLMELNMWIRCSLIRGSDMEMVSYAM
jgi:hypothetical protein